MPAVPPKSYGISDFKSKALNLAQTSLYQLTISKPGIAGKNPVPVNSLSEDLSLLCYEASLPGSSLMTHDVTNDYYGLSEKMAYRRNFGQDITLSFYVDRNYQIVSYLENWINEIITPVGAPVGNSNVHFIASYPESYKTRMHIVKFEKDHFSFEQAPLPSKTSGSKAILNYEFIDAFPTAINSIPISYDQSSILKCTVTFSYSRYLISNTLSASPQTSLQEPSQQTATGVPAEQTPSQRLVPVRGTSGVVFYNTDTDTRNTATLNDGFLSQGGGPGAFGGRE